MGTTTFSGPIRAGNIRNTNGTTVGSDVANVGYVVMAQAHTADLSGGALTASLTDIVIPANSKIVNIVVDMETAANTASNISVGQQGGNNNTFINALSSGTTAGLKTITTQGGGTLAWDVVQPLAEAGQFELGGSSSGHKSLHPCTHSGGFTQ